MTSKAHVQASCVWLISPPKNSLMHPAHKFRRWTCDQKITHVLEPMKNVYWTQPAGTNSKHAHFFHCCGASIVPYKAVSRRPNYSPVVACGSALGASVYSRHSHSAWTNAQNTSNDLTPNMVAMRGGHGDRKTSCEERRARRKKKSPSEELDDKIGCVACEKDVEQANAAKDVRDETRIEEARDTLRRRPAIGNQAAPSCTKLHRPVRHWFQERTAGSDTEWPHR